MPQHHLNDDHFTQTEKDEINDGWKKIMNVVEAKTRNLTVQEKQRYGSVSEHNKLIVLKTMEFDTNQPILNCPDVDYTELRADWDDRMFMAGFITRMEGAIKTCDNIRITHDWDAIKASEVDYKYAKYKMSTDPGSAFEAKYGILKEFFTTFSGLAAGEDPIPPVVAN